MKKRTAKVLKWLGVAAIALSLIYTLLLWQANRDIQRAYSALEADGRPMRVEQIIPPAIPDTDNAALVYRAVALQLKSESGGGNNLFHELADLADRMRADSTNPQPEERFRELSERPVVRDAFIALRRGTEKKGCRYDLDYSEGAGILLPHLQDLRNLSKILSAQARLNAAEGNVEQAWNDVIASLKLANALAREPILMSQLVRCAQFEIAVDLIHSVAAYAPPSQSQNEEIEELLLTFEDRSNLVAAIDGERLLLGEWAFALPRSALQIGNELEDGAAREVVEFVVSFNPLLRRDHAAYLTTMHAYAEAASEPYYSREASFEEEMLNAVPWYCFVTQLITPAYSSVREIFASMQARAKVARAGLAALQYEAEVGAYPSDLASIAPEGLLDPFTGEPLYYTATPAGFAVYSVGENLTDDGDSSSSGERSDDIIWTYVSRARM